MGANGSKQHSSKDPYRGSTQKLSSKYTSNAAITDQPPPTASDQPPPPKSAEPVPIATHATSIPGSASSLSGSTSNVSGTSPSSPQLPHPSPYPSASPRRFLKGHRNSKTDSTIATSTPTPISTTTTTQPMAILAQSKYSTSPPPPDASADDSTLSTSSNIPSSPLSPLASISFTRTATNTSSSTDTKLDIDVDDIIARLLDVRNNTGKGGKPSKSLCLKNSEVMAVCHRAREIFMEQPILLELNPPVNIVGDIHGQYPDLLRIFDLCGFPPSSNYLFLGDYVDRGRQSLETILLLLCLKIKNPENFFILRGNHECASVNRVYGFYDECKRRVNLKVWKTFTDVFNCLPVAAVVAGKIFCVHGGLSPSLGSMDDIRGIQRPTDVPDYGLLNGRYCEMLG
ncbi:hypothetical protein HK102_007349 [Quaeritorhiza haematococci]|nr:hypothetical protein HK102_007349 [Quaeritorhiza haematococci]